MSPAGKRGVVVVAPTPPPVHGVSIMTDLLIDGLDKAGRLSAHIDSRDTRESPSMGRFDLAKTAASLRLLIRVVASLRRDKSAALYVPISQSPWALARDGLFLYAARVLGRDRIIHLHGGYLGHLLDRHPVARLLLRGALRGRAVGWVLTESLRPQLGALLDDAHVDVLSNAVPDPTSLSFGAERADDARANLVFVSNLRPEKGHDLLLSSLEQIPEHRSIFRVQLAGEGDLESVADVTRRVATLSDQGWDITYHGPVSPADRWRLLDAADIFVMPTHYRYEGQPLVILEALASSCAVVATAHAGIPDTITDGVEGRIVPADAQRIADALLELATSPDLLHAAQAAARHRYEQAYTPGIFFARLAAITRTLDSAQP